MFFRVDGGNIYSVAMGHIYRCLKTALVLRKVAGISSTFIMKDFEKGVRKVKEHGFEVITLEQECSLEEDIEKTCSYASGEFLAMDVRHYTPQAIKKVKERVLLVLVFDDLGNNEYAPHIIVNPSVCPEHQIYRQRFADDYYLGGEYFILGIESIPRVSAKERINKVAVSLGGADPDGYTLELASKVVGLADKYDFSFILGPAYGDVEDFKRHLNAIGFKANVFHNVSNLPDLLARTDMAIVSGGDTCLELAYTGTSGIIIPTIEYEEQTASYLQRMEVFINLGDIKKRTSSDVVKDITNFVDNYELRKKYSENGKSMIDGNGSERIANMILQRTG